MTVLLTGLLLFFSVHSVRIVANDWRTRQVEKFGAGPWKIVFSIVSLLGLLLIINGYGAARLDPVWLWGSPPWTRYLAALLTIPAFILLVATYFPGSMIKVKLGHPMLAAVKIWAFAHLLANGTLADLLLFGSFMVWAIVNFAVSRRRDRLTGITPGAVRPGADVQVVVIGIVSWILVVFFLHGPLFGVYPLG